MLASEPTLDQVNPACRLEILCLAFAISSHSMSRDSYYRLFAVLTFAVYPILFLYANFPGEAAWSLALLPLILALGGALVIFVSSFVVFREGPRATLFSAFLVFLFYAFGHASNALGLMVVSLGAGNGENLLYVNPVLGLLCSSLIVIVFFVIRRPRSQRWIHALDKILPVISLTLLIFVMLPILWGLVGGEKRQDAHLVPSAANLTSSLGYQPDIYFVVLDGYAREDYLQKYYGHDNGPYLESLESLGFQVMRDSWADYRNTYLSLASTLNMTLLDDVLRELKGAKNRRGPMHRMIRDNKVSQFLRQRGYRYVHLASTGGETITNPAADIVYSCRQTPFQHEIYRVLVEGSLLRAFFENLSVDLAACHLENYELLSQIPAREADPKFVFAHFVSPHHPYLFDRDGKVLRRATISNQFQYDKMLWARKKEYIDQLIFVSKKIKETFETIIKNSKKPPVIILVSDHGPGGGIAGPDEEEQRRFRLANLTAVHIPGRRDVLPEGLRLVQLFPSIFSELFPKESE